MEVWSETKLMVKEKVVVVVVVVEDEEEDDEDKKNCTRSYTVKLLTN